KLDQIEEALLPSPKSGAPEIFQHRALRKLGRSAQAAVSLVDHAAKLGGGIVEARRSNRHRPFRAGGGRQALHQRIAVLGDALRLFPKHARELAAHRREGGSAVARFLGKVSSTP